MEHNTGIEKKNTGIVPAAALRMRSRPVPFMTDYHGRCPYIAPPMVLKNPIPDPEGQGDADPQRPAGTAHYKPIPHGRTLLKALDGSK